MTAKLISFFGSRLEETIRSWPSSTREEVGLYLHLPDRREDLSRRLDGRAAEQPYWILLPFWLAEKFTQNGARGLGRHFLDDISWAQYCLFVFTRMQDDLFDKHTHQLPLLYAADGFLFEAERVFLRYFPKNSPFWEIFISGIEETIFAVARADDLEKTSVRSNTKLLSSYGDTAAICNIAAAAVCLKAGKKRDISHITMFSKEMMKAGAIVDDLRDIEDDLRRGRFNYAATYFLPVRGEIRSPTNDALRLIRRNFRNSSKVSRLFCEIRRHVTIAEKAIRPLAVPAAAEYLYSDRRTLETMEDMMKWQKTNRVLNG